MTSLSVALSFLSHIGFSQSNARTLMSQFNNDMSRLMICSNKECLQFELSLDFRLRLLRAVRCFHKEKWSKYLMNHFHHDQSLKNDVFEKFVYHLVKCHIWIIYASWTLNYIRKSLILTKDIDRENLRLFYEKIQQLKSAILRLKQMIGKIKKHFS